MADHAEFLKLLLTHQADLQAFLGSLVRSRTDCEDVFQETVLTLWDKFDEFDRQRSFGAWARGVASKKVLQYRDRLERVPTLLSPEAIAAVADAFERREDVGSVALDALAQCTEPLPEHSRHILRLRYAEWWPVLRIAEHLGDTPAAVSKTLSRLRARLFECVQRRLGRLGGKGTVPLFTEDSTP